MSAPLAIFRLEATPTLGAGHMARCRVFAAALITEGWRVRFAVSAETRSSIGAPDDAILMPADPKGEPAVLRAAEPSGCDLLVVDHYGRDATFEQACRPWARYIFAVDDLADRPHDADWLLDPTPGRTAADYAVRLQRNAGLLLGSNYALIDPRFAAARPSALARRHASGAAARILVSPGGTDPTNVCGLALDALAGIKPELAVDVALLPSAPHLAHLPEKAGPRVMFHTPATDMTALITKADLAIGAGGGSAWERCCLGLPTLLVITAENQRLNARRLKEAGAAIIVGEADNITAEQLRNMIINLAGDGPRLRLMAAAAAALCDGGGVKRAVAAVGTRQ